MFSSNDCMEFPRRAVNNAVCLSRKKAEPYITSAAFFLIVVRQMNQIGGNDCFYTRYSKCHPLMRVKPELFLLNMIDYPFIQFLTFQTPTLNYLGAQLGFSNSFRRTKIIKPFAPIEVLFATGYSSFFLNFVLL